MDFQKQGRNGYVLLAWAVGRTSTVMVRGPCGWSSSCPQVFLSSDPHSTTMDEWREQSFTRYPQIASFLGDYYGRGDRNHKLKLALLIPWTYNASIFLVSLKLTAFCFFIKPCGLVITHFTGCLVLFNLPQKLIVLIPVETNKIFFGM